MKKRTTCMKPKDVCSVHGHNRAMYIVKVWLMIVVVGLSINHSANAQYWNSITNTPDIDNINQGNVGIGTPPTEKLTVQGNLKFGGNLTTLYNFYIKLYEGSGVVNNGNGRNLFILAGPSDNAAGKSGGHLYLRPGSPTAPAITYGNVYLADEGGNVGIGTANPGNYKLAVEGKIGAREVVVTTAAWADYVFEPSYHLRPLSEVETFLKENKHLPEIPSAKDVEANGVNLGEMNMLLLKKVEELTLYVIELKKENDEMKKEMEKLK
jgi:hypothetical protein